MRARLWGPIIVLCLWQLIAVSGLVNRLILPSPLEAGTALVQNAGALSLDFASTFARLGIGFVLGGAAGVVMGTWFGMSRRLYGFFELVIDFFRSLPVITLFPLAMIMFGLGDPSKIALTAWTVFLLVVVNTIYGVRQVPRTRVLATRTLGAKGTSLLFKVLLPSAIPTIIGGLRLAVSLGLVVVLVTEMFTGTASGLGKRIFDSGLIYEIPTMYAAILIAGMTGFLLNKAIAAIERRVAHWSGT